MFRFRNGALHAESIPLGTIAREYGMPCFGYWRVALCAARNLTVVDAAMNDQFRPALYEAWHDIFPVRNDGVPKDVYDMLGPARKSADFLVKERELALREGELLAVMSGGAYAICLSSNYNSHNSRPRAAKVMADGTRTPLAREREHPKASFALEHDFALNC